MQAEIYCEYLKNPVGIDMGNPRFSWVVSGAQKGEKQESYLLQVATTPEFSDNSIVWEKKEKSAETAQISYEGNSLVTATYYYYKVEIWTDRGRRICSDTGYFLTGLMEKEWKGAWVGGPMLEEDTFWFRTQLGGLKNTRRAVAFVASPNYYVLTVNGQKSTDTVLNNAWTDCEKTLLYGVFDITKLMRDGENVFGMEVGNGWNALEMGFHQYGLGEHLFSLQICITDETGALQWFRPEPVQWEYTVEGPVRMNSIYNGEDYDARMELGNWDTPEYNREQTGVVWKWAVEFEPPAGTVKAQVMEPIRVVRLIRPKTVRELPDGSFVFDMGQNFAGWAKLKVCAEEGTKITLEYAELEYEDHTLNKLSLRGVRAAETYICRGNGEEIFEPSFTYHGFRYVRLSGLTYEPKEDTLVGCVVRSAVEKTGYFQCSNNLLNQLQSNIQWTEESNLYGIPTDCPQRDERLGWLNDMTVRNEAALYNFRLASLYTKWLGDIRDTQGEKTGAISDTAPYRRFGQRPADPVCSSFLLIPWNMYCQYGDRRVLEENYQGMKRWADYLLRNSQDYILPYAPFGDWAAPAEGTDQNSIGGGAASSITSPRLMATGYLFYDCELMEKVAGILGREEDQEFYREQKELVKTAFQKAFYHDKEKYYGKNSQASNTFPLYLGLVTQEDKRAVLDHLLKDIVETHQMHLTTGNLCSRYIIEVLLTEGYEDVAYELLTQTTYPSWGYMIENGATTIWERWEKVTEPGTLSKMASYNHPMNGAVGVCFYKYLAGIRADESEPGFRNVKICPILPAKLEMAHAKIDTIRGRVESRWEKKERELCLEVSIPFNCTGEIFVPVEGEDKDKLRVDVDGVCAFRDGKGRAAEIPFVESMEPEDGYLVFRVASGNYTFVRTWEQ